MKLKITVLILLLTAVLFAQVEWEQDLPIRQGTNIEWFRSATTLNDAVVYVWSDTKQGGRDLYAQKVDAQGNILWNEGLPVTVDEKIDRQEDPVVIATNDNSVVVAWVDFSNDSHYSDVFVQKINNDGELMWQDGGVPLCTATDIQISLNIVPNNIGGAIVIWQDYRSAGGVDIYGASLNADGENIWTENGVAIADADGSQTGHTFWEDGNGGAVMAYVDNLGGDTNIMAKGIGSDGTITWSQTICDYGDGIEQTRVKSAKDNEGGFIFVWQDKRNIDTDLYGQRINSAGDIQWEEDGILVASTPNEDLNPRLTTNSDNGAFLAWESGAAASSDLYITKILNDGSTPWGNVIVSDAANAQNNPRLIGNADGGTYVTWEDSRNGNYPNIDIYAQYISADGSEMWDEGGKAVCTQPGPQIGNLAKIADGDLFINWSDARNGSVGLFYQTYDSAGNNHLEQDGIEIFWGLSGNAVNIYPVQANDGYYFVWLDTRKGYLGAQIYVQKIDEDGNIAFAENGNNLSEKVGTAKQENLAVVKHHQNGIMVTWQETRETSPRVYFQHMNENGEYYAEYGTRLTNEAERDQKNPMLNEIDGEYYFVWEDMTNDWFQGIYAQKVVDNEIQWGDRGIQIDLPEVGQGDIVLNDFVDNYIIYSKGFLGDIFVKKLNPDGTTAEGYPESGLTICDDPAVQQNAEGIKTNDGLIIVWEDLRNGTSDIYAQKILTDGTIVWEANGVPYVDNAGDQSNFNLAKSDGTSSIVWEDRETGVADLKVMSFNQQGEEILAPTFAVERDSTQKEAHIEIFGANNMIVFEDQTTEMSNLYMQFVNSSGNITTGQNNGIILCDAPKNQYTPKILKIDENTALVGWVDARSSGKEEIKGLYAQKVIVSDVDTNEEDIPFISKGLNNYPNPFNPTTTIRFNVPANQKVSLEVFNIRGQRVKTLINDKLDKGNHSIVWNGTDNNDKNVGSGVYMYKLTTGDSIQTNKMLLLK